MQILVVDDDNNMRKTLVTLLEENHQVTDFGDPIPALDFLKDNYVDLVITDNKMPGITGQELIVQGKEISPSTSFAMESACLDKISTTSFSVFKHSRTCR